MDIVTPNEISKKGFGLMDTNADGMTGIVIPLNLTPDSVTGTVKILCAGREDLQLLQDTLDSVPRATEGGAYRLTVDAYEADSDRLVHFTGEYSVEVIPAIVRDIDERDVSIEWE